KTEVKEAVRVYLAERIIVDSVIDYLMETGEMETLVHDYLHKNQFHEGAFGDTVEVGLATSVKRLSSQTLPQSERFTSVFQTVYKISTKPGDCALKQDARLVDYFLEEGYGLLSDWRPPKGPDLMFVFKEREGTRRVIFAIQTGNVDAAKAEVLRTMDPDLWFSTKGNLKQGSQAELKACNDDNTIEFLSVLLIAPLKLSVSMKHAKAIIYMEERVSFSPDWRKTFLEAVEALSRAEARYQKQPNLEEARDGLEKAQQALRQMENEFPNVQSRKTGDIRETGETSKMGGDKNRGVIAIRLA
ncbi:MAG: hypothetical protein Q9187_007836, partial [Circinaria calcarea]